MRNRGFGKFGVHLATSERRQLHRWRPVSTAPYNHDLELRVTEDGSVTTMPFPCRHTNSDEWINVDLGVPLKIQPVEWRAWQQGKSPSARRSSILAPAASAARRLKQWVQSAPSKA
jgi:hypothetical protein